MRLVTLALGLALLAAPAAALAQAAPAHYSVSTTPIGDLLDDPAAKALLIKYLPDLAKSDQIDMARGMTLKDIQQYAPTITDKTLADMDVELAALPAKK